MFTFVNAGLPLGGLRLGDLSDALSLGILLASVVSALLGYSWLRFTLAHPDASPPAPR